MLNEGNKSEVIKISKDDACKALGISDSHLRKLATEHNFHYDAQSYDVIKLLQYLKTRKEKPRSKNMDSAKLRKLQAEIKLLNMKYKEQEGNLLPKDEVINEVQSAAIMLREQHQDLITRYQSLLSPELAKALETDIKNLDKRYAAMLSKAAQETI